ncbi:MAG TPA: SBBP repeat-containing protein [Blastocatellia bacterium]|nr:SBBP repeat-containing protein [Blastocatellia bacterium]
MKTSHNVARLLALLFGLIGLLNISSVHVYSFGASQSAPTALSGYGYKAPAFGYDLTRVKEFYSRIPLSFLANHGQADKKVKFLSRGSGYSLALAPTTFTLAVADPRNKNNEKSIGRSRVSAYVLQATLVGANAAANLTGLEQLPTRTNYFIGSDPRRWKTNLPNYAKVKYSGVYPGVDLVFYGNQDLLEYDFIVSPGADPGVIALGFEGMTDMRIDEKGDLILRTDAGEIRQSRPVVYQQVDDARRIIPASYLIKGKKQIAFQIAKYDRSKPLVIDPTLAFSTYLGGSSSDGGVGIAVDSAGNAYITGSTVSTDFPVTPGAFQTGRAGPFPIDDAFVTKMNSTGTALIYSTYFGGSNRDAGDDIALDGAGNAYVTGRTESSDLPTTPGAFRTTPVGSDESDVFAMKLNATGTALVYSTYLGPAIGSGIAVDSAGNAYITGQANGDYPTTPGAFQTVSGGSSEAFVTKLNSTGTALVYSTFLGGSGFDFASEIAIDSAGNAYVTGEAGAGFPVTPGAFQTSFNGAREAFVTKLNAAGTALVYSTFLGGSGDDAGFGIAVNAAGNAYVTGFSDSLNFPATPGAFQTVKAAGTDAFVTQLSAAGNALVYSTYLGGNGNDLGNDIALDMAGNASVVGLTGSSDFPTTADAIQSSNAGNNDAFITRLNPTGTGLVFSTYLGGSNGDSGFSISVDPAGSIYITGGTGSADFPTTPGAFQTVFGGGFSDAFVAKIVFSSFDVCFKDDGNGDLFQFDSTTGEYRFTQCSAGGLTLTGTGALSRQGCLLLIEDNQSGRRVRAHFNHCNMKGHAVIQIESGRKRTFVITDKDTSNSNCACN